MDDMRHLSPEELRDATFFSSFVINNFGTNNVKYLVTMVRVLVRIWQTHKNCRKHVRMYARYVLKH